MYPHVSLGWVRGRSEQGPLPDARWSLLGAGSRFFDFFLRTGKGEWCQVEPSVRGAQHTEVKYWESSPAGMAQRPS